MKISTILAILISTLFISSCKEEPTKPQTETILTLEVLDKSCTEVWIDVKANDQTNKLGSVYLNDEFRTQFYLKDTLVYLDELLPNKTYTIKLTNQDGIGTQTEFTTMDTTSHNFTWETFEFGGGSSSILRDVTIIDENNIWAVGEIHTADDKYNAIHWNGSHWELKKIYYYGNCSAVMYPSLKAINAFSEEEIVLTNGGSIGWFDGNIVNLDCTVNPLLTGAINKIWGTSSYDIYVVGNNGNIAHWDGSNWEKIESGTDVDLVDIWGSPDGNTIWVCGNEDFKPTILLKIENQQAELLYSNRDNLFSYDFNRLSGNFRSVWTDSDNFLYILTSYDLYRAKNEDLTKPSALWRNADNQIATLRARGSGSNDIFTVGNEGLLCHYNGVSWRTYTGLYSRFKTYRGLSVKDNIIVAVGQDYINGIEDKAIITITKR